MSKENKQLKMQLQFASAPKINQLDIKVSNLEKALDEKDTELKFMKNKYDVLYTGSIIIYRRTMYTEQFLRE